MFLVDTDVVSELRRAKPHGAVLSWLHDKLDVQLHLSAVTLGELQAGVELTRRQDAAKAESIERWIDQFQGVWNVLPLEGQTFRIWARSFRARATIEDGLIAATAIQHDLAVVTRNIRDFESLGVRMIDPFKS